MQGKTAVRWHFTPTKVVTIKKRKKRKTRRKSAMAVRDVEKPELLCTMGGGGM